MEPVQGVRLVPGLTIPPVMEWQSVAQERSPLQMPVIVVTTWLLRSYEEGQKFRLMIDILSLSGTAGTVREPAASSYCSLLFILNLNLCTSEHTSEHIVLLFIFVLLFVLLNLNLCTYFIPLEQQRHYRSEKPGHDRQFIDDGATAYISAKHLAPCRAVDITAR